MESKTISTTIITLELNEIEAIWLKGVVQNPIHGNSQTEGKFERNMRESFWNALKDDTVNIKI